MSSKNAKNVLAENPLDAILGFGSALATRRSKVVESVQPPPPPRKHDRPRSEDDSAPTSERAAEAVPSARDVEFAEARRNVTNREEQTSIEPQDIANSRAATAEVTVTPPVPDVARTNAVGLQSAVEGPAVDAVTHVVTDTAVQETPSVHREFGHASTPALDAMSPPSASPELEQGRAPAANNQAEPLVRAAAEKTQQQGVPNAERSDRLNTSRTQLHMPSAPLTAAAVPERSNASLPPKSTAAKTANSPTQVRAAATPIPSITDEPPFEESSTGTLQAVRSDETTTAETTTSEDDELAGRGASFRHRIGTIQEPYVRADGTKVRQWSITLPHELIRRVSHLALDRGVKPAVLAQEALEQLLADADRSRA